ncbi:DUF397 domain-containing protein [Amycolatopsis sp. lyj-23]|uniref:DUF397 domain-containing protein n=1 Tax=Amycolatopsis sp. lyj-23 TaxID=2789283 RepID=UPI003979F2A9
MQFYDAPVPTADFDESGWHRSSFSGSNGGTCVEVNLTSRDAVGVRDSKLVVSPVLEFPHDTWDVFCGLLRRQPAG